MREFRPASLTTTQTALIVVGAASDENCAGATADYVLTVTVDGEDVKLENNGNVILE